MSKLKRFRIFNTELQTRPFEADTLEEIYGYLKDKWSIGDLFIDCAVDDIEVPAEDFKAAWEKGERPADLQMF